MTIYWTDQREDIEGSRWEVWEKNLQSIIPWNDFKQLVLHTPTMIRGGNVGKMKAR